MGKIGIVTNYTNINYGSVLQAYAMQRTLADIGYDSENIRYSYADVVAKPVRRPVLKQAIHVAHQVRYLDEFFRRKSFRAFRRNCIKESVETYDSLEALRFANRKYDFFICGSDQIWAPFQFCDWYYLEFVSDNARKIAYAPSFGVTELSSQWPERKRVSELIRNIEYISVREPAGAVIIKDLTGRDAPVVLDPTLLLDKNDWLDQMKPRLKMKTPYILCYFLGEKASHRRAAEKVRQLTGLPLAVFPLRRSDYRWGDCKMRRCGPWDFVNLLAGADLILTDSFHGTAFALNFNVPFFSFKRFDDKDPASQNSRVESILGLVKMTDRLLGEDIPSSLQMSVDYRETNEILSRERIISKRYLTDALNGSAVSCGV